LSHNRYSLSPIIFAYRSILLLTELDYRLTKLPKLTYIKIESKMFRFLVFISFFLLPITAPAQGSHSQNEANQVPVNEKNSEPQATATDILSSLEKAISVNTIDIRPMLAGSVELGVLYKTGNTHSADMKTGIDLRVEKERWLSLLNIDLLIKKTDIADADTDEIHFKTTDKKWTIASQTNYNLNNIEKNYIYGAVWYEENDFSGFINQSSVSTGWGRHWYKTNKASLWGDIGPGFKRDEFRASDDEPVSTVTSWIMQVQALYIRKLGENIELKQYLSAKKAIKTNVNSTYKAQTSLTTKLISTLQLKFSFTVNYNTDVEDDKKNVDTQTTVTLVYSF
jgi:putative salt-induced outer membrane protein YdiY